MDDAQAKFLSNMHGMDAEEQLKMCMAEGPDSVEKILHSVLKIKAADAPTYLLTLMVELRRCISGHPATLRLPTDHFVVDSFSFDCFSFYCDFLFFHDCRHYFQCDSPALRLSAASSRATGCRGLLK